MPIRENVTTTLTTDSNGNTVEIICSSPKSTSIPPAASVLETIPRADVVVLKPAAVTAALKETKGSKTTKKQPKAATAAAAAPPPKAANKSIASFFTKPKEPSSASAAADKPAHKTLSNHDSQLISSDAGKRFMEAVRYGETKLLESMEASINSGNNDNTNKHFVLTAATAPPAATETDDLKPSSSTVPITSVPEIAAADSDSQPIVSSTVKDIHILQARSKKVKSPPPSTALVVPENTTMEVEMMDTSPPVAQKRSAEDLDTTESTTQPSISILQPRSKKKKMCDAATSPFLNDDLMNNAHVVLLVSDSTTTTNRSTVTTATAVTDEEIMVIDTSHEPSGKETSMIVVDKNASGSHPPPPASSSSSIHPLDTSSTSTPAEIQILQNQIISLRVKYTTKLEDLVQRVVQGLVEEEEGPSDVRKLDTFMEEEEEEVSVLETASKVSSNTTTTVEFNDEWLPELAVHVQGSRLSLRSLTHKVYSRLRENPKMNMVSYNTVMDKIKIIATRKQYLSTADKSQKVDKFQDTNERFMWRWELISLDLLPESMKASVKKARANRSKLQGHHKAIQRLLTLLHECDILASSTEPLSLTKRDEMIAKITEEEEKVLKFERENEKHRLLEESKALKLKDKELKQAEKLQEKARAEDERRLEKERKKQEAADAKRKKEEEAQRQKDLAAEKQKARLLSFFKPSVSPTKPVADTTKSRPTDSGDTHPSSPHAPLKNSKRPSSSQTFSSVESHAFWKCLGKGSHPVQEKGLFSKLSMRARQSRKRKTQRISFTAFVRAISENDFDNRVYDEEKTVMIRNKFKFLGFHEDFRPPYHGTWSKPRSKIIAGRNPFRQDNAYLDYSYDSEGEWEEGEDEEGDNCSESGQGDEEVEEEEGDDLDYQDGWLAQEDDIKYEDNEDLDEEAKALRKMKLNGHSSNPMNRAYSIAPRLGGIPIDCNCPDLVPEGVLQGIAFLEAKQSLASFTVEVVLPSLVIRLDAFPPPVDSDERNTEGEQLKGSASTELSDENLRAFVKFVHNCTLTSKDTIVEEFRTLHKDIIVSRAHALRKLDSVASKKRAKAGVIWEVKPEILESLGLQQNSSDSIDDAGSCVKPIPPSSMVAKSPSSVTPTLLESTLDNPVTSDEMKQKHAQVSVSDASVNLLAKFLENQKCSKF